MPSCVLAPLPQLKQGEIHASTEVAAELAAPSSPMEVQHFGYALLQHLVRSPDEAMPPHGVHTGSRSSPPVKPALCAMTLQVGTRWAEYSEQEHAQLASLAFDMLTRGEVA